MTGQRKKEVELGTVDLIKERAQVPAILGLKGQRGLLQDTQSRMPQARWKRRLKLPRKAVCCH